MQNMSDPKEIRVPSCLKPCEERDSKEVEISERQQNKTIQNYET